MRWTLAVASLWGSIAAISLLMLVAPTADAASAAEVRFVQAAPDRAQGQLAVKRDGRTTRIGAPVRFGAAGTYNEVEPGTVTLEALAPEGRTAAEAPSQPLEAGERYTVMLLGGDQGPKIKLFRDAEPEAGRAKVRVIQAAPELGGPTIELSGRVIARRADFEQATPDVALPPGAYDLSLRRPGPGGEPILAQRNIALAAGTTSTAFVVGTQGQRTRALIVTDDTLAPRGAPETGLGGLDRAPGLPWLLIALATLAGGIAGGAGFELAGRRRDRARGDAVER